MHIACLKCNVMLRCKKNSVGVEVMADFGPYQYFHADLWACPSCGLEIITGFGSKPVVEHYQRPQYDQILGHDRRNKQVFRVWDSESAIRRYYSREQEVSR